MTQPANYREKLLFGGYRVGVWGIGYIGLSTMAHYAACDVATVGVDTNTDRVQSVNSGEIYIPGLKYWLGFEIAPLVKQALMRATLDASELMRPDVLVHFVCIPTEKDGQPYYVYLDDVLEKLSRLHTVASSLPPLLIVESTLTPGTTTRHVIPTLERAGLRVGRDLLLAVAPRRDWFTDRDKSLRALDRVFGGVSPAATERAREVLGIVCERLHEASSHETAEMVKSVENAYRHMEITLANQLSLAYPRVNMREVLRLVGTKWNAGTFHPSFGTGGYCIPLSSQYVIEGAERPEFLTLLRSTIETDRRMPELVARTCARKGCRSVGILGLSYRGNLKVPILSPAIGIAQALRGQGVEVRLFDPYFSDEEIRIYAGVGSFQFPEELDLFDAVVVVADHREFTTSGVHQRLGAAGRLRLILDNVGIWSDLGLEKRGIEYHVAGDAGWLEI